MAESCTPIKRKSDAELRKRRQRICKACGRDDSIRADCKSETCRKCSSAVAILKARAALPPARVSICEHCKQPYTGDNERFCSMTCMNKERRVERSCETCGTIFQICRSHVNGRSSVGRFCSRPCYAAWLRKPDRGPGHAPSWKLIREETLRRFPFCALCGTTKDLEVHHIEPHRISGDNSQENLIPLCHKHHDAVEVIYRRAEAIVGQPTPSTRLIWQAILGEKQDVIIGHILEMRERRRGN